MIGINKHLLTVIARIVTSGLLLSYDIRRHTCICVEGPPRNFIVIGSKVRRLYADDESSVGIIRKVIKGGGHSGFYSINSCIEVGCGSKLDVRDVLSARDVLRNVKYPLSSPAFKCVLSKYLNLP